MPQERAKKMEDPANAMKVFRGVLRFGESVRRSEGEHPARPRPERTSIVRWKMVPRNCGRYPDLDSFADAGHAGQRFSRCALDETRHPYQLQELGPSASILTEYAEHRARHRDRVLLLDPAHRHTQM